MAKQIIDSDLVPVHDSANPKKVLTTLFWGDEVDITGKVGGKPAFDLRRDEWDQETQSFKHVIYKAVLPAKTKFRKDGVLKVRFVDVAQGDGALLESPSGKLVLIDGGESHHFRRYLQRAFSHVVQKKPLHVDAIVVTHGDADHFAGLTELAHATRKGGDGLIEVDRIFHNGLVKGPTSMKGDILGKRKKVDGKDFIVELYDDLLQIAETRLNVPFKNWVNAIRGLKKRNGKLKTKRLEWGDAKAFDFLDKDGIKVEVLGPITSTVGGKPALPFLSAPGSKSNSASHTINGHSVVLRVSYGNVRFLFGADLNEESEEALLVKCREEGQSLEAEVLKVPHHGSSDFSPNVLDAIRPVVSVVSSGDESAVKEYIHPRAGLVGALGKYSRASVEKPLIYVTEMVAFFKKLGAVEAFTLKNGQADKSLGQVANAYSKTSFGIVHVRTDGERVLVATHSGSDKKEAYVFRVDERGAITFEEPQIAR